jgi:antitoxin VapB
MLSIASSGSLRPKPCAAERNGICSSICQRLKYDLRPYVETTQMPLERHVRLFRNGRNQAIRIPREFELVGNEAIIRREGDRLIIEPVAKQGLLVVLATLEPISETFADPAARLLPVEDVNL